MSQPYAQPGYPQTPQQPQYQQPTPQGWPQPQQQPQYQQQQPSVPLAAGSLDAFYAQPSTGQGAGLRFPQDGAWHLGIVNRALTDADTEQQTDLNTRQPAFFRDGRPKFALKIPLNVPATQESQDGKAQWYCAGAARDDLIRAMNAAGAPQGPPEPGAAIYICKTGTRPVGSGMRANVWEVRYWRPADAQALAGQYGIEYPEMSAQPAQAPTQAAPAQQAPQQQQVAPPPPAPAPTQAPPPAPPAPGAPNDLSPEKQALLASLTGQPAPAQG